jgi:hypothetical protein
MQIRVAAETLRSPGRSRYSSAQTRQRRHHGAETCPFGEGDSGSGTGAGSGTFPAPCGEKTRGAGALQTRHAGASASARVRSGVQEVRMDWAAWAMAGAVVVATTVTTIWRDRRGA